MSDAGSDARSARGMSIGAKLLVGCLAVGALGVVGVAVAVGIGGFALKRGIDSVAAQADDQAKATRVLDRLARDHPFKPPRSGAVSAEQRRRFADASKRSWNGIQPWAPQIHDMTQRLSVGTDQPGVRDMLGAVRATVGISRTRLVIARALEEERMALAEYVWIGRHLIADDPDALASVVPADVDAKLVYDLAAMWSVSPTRTAR